MRANQSNFMARKLSKAIMRRSNYAIFLKEKSEVSYTTQRNYCVNLLRKTKRECFANIKINNITDNKKFWQTVKPLFSDKINHRETINLIDNEVTLYNDEEITETSINIFVILLKTYHYQKILLLRSHQLHSLLTLLYLHWRNMKIIQA